jgi:hypothetical protein
LCPGGVRSSHRQTAGEAVISLEILHSVEKLIPETQFLSAGEVLRFALGTATGPRSNVWTVFGSKHADDVYVGARDELPTAKLSLHQSGKWRRALTSQSAIRQDLPADSDRVAIRWEVPEPFTEGWLHAVTITIPCSSM